MEKKQFKAESQRLLDLMINSIYTHKEIFLREIISNASDAIDKLAYLSLTEDNGMNRDDFAITISVDKDHRALTISDNGIGMSQEEMENNLGTIAKSGSYQFKQDMKQAESAEQAVDIIGQFGVGFYSAFMVADNVSVVSRRYGEETAHIWQSEGVDGYTIEDCERETCGTDVILKLKDNTEDEDYDRYLNQYTIQNLIKKYSDYIRYPIHMMVTGSRPVEKEDEKGEKKTEYEEYQEDKVLNSMVPIWQKNKDEVTDDEYDQYYMDKFNDFEKPSMRINVNVEGAVTYKALMYVPSKAPYNYYTKEFKKGLQLYSNGVLIMDACEDLVPDHFSFVKGVVDSQDLSLNISREMLQHDRQLKLIGANLEKKVRAELDYMLKNKREEYEKFFRNFGRQLKLCALNDFGAKKEDLQDLLLFWSTKEGKLVSLAEYTDRMAENQKYIYYASGASVEAIDRMPQTEILKDHGMEILCFTEQADEFIAEMFHSYKEKAFRSVLSGDLGLEDEKKEKDEEKEKKNEDAFRFIKDTLGDRVDEVKAAETLKSHPVCMSPGEGISFEMERYFKAVNQENMGLKAKRILEINVDHPAFAAFEAARQDDPERAKKFAEIFYTQAMMIAGMPVEDPSSYTDLLCSLW